jgi:hypothetical protein
LLLLTVQLLQRLFRLPVLLLYLLLLLLRLL